MIYPYIVNKNGVWYPAGTEVPEGTEQIIDNKSIQSQNTSNDVIENVLENKTVKTYTKREINRMSNANLKQLAQEQDIDDIDSKTGTELKKLLIEKFGL